MSAGPTCRVGQEVVNNFLGQAFLVYHARYIEDQWPTSGVGHYEFIHIGFR